ncbi:hypothetical protein BH11BAC5_BH11BAC5_55010 [soil metagenome]
MIFYYSVHPVGELISLYFHVQKMKQLKKIVPLAIFGCLLLMISHAAPLQPAALTCEYTSNPLGIDTRVRLVAHELSK